MEELKAPVFDNFTNHLPAVSHQMANNMMLIGFIWHSRHLETYMHFSNLTFPPVLMVATIRPGVAMGISSWLRISARERFWKKNVQWYHRWHWQEKVSGLKTNSQSWWRHDLEALSVSLALSDRNQHVTSQEPLTGRFCFYRHPDQAAAQTIELSAKTRTTKDLLLNGLIRNKTQWIWYYRKIWYAEMFLCLHIVYTQTCMHTCPHTHSSYMCTHLSLHCFPCSDFIGSVTLKTRKVITLITSANSKSRVRFL